MFHRAPTRRRPPSATSIERLRACGFTLLDAQVPTPHLERLGAISIPRGEYLARLRAALEVRASLSAA